MYDHNSICLQTTKSNARPHVKKRRWGWGWGVGSQSLDSRWLYSSSSSGVGVSMYESTYSLCFVFITHEVSVSGCTAIAHHWLDNESSLLLHLCLSSEVALYYNCSLYYCLLSVQTANIMAAVLTLQSLLSHPNCS